MKRISFGQIYAFHDREELHAMYLKTLQEQVKMLIEENLSLKEELTGL